MTTSRCLCDGHVQVAVAAVLALGLWIPSATCAQSRERSWNPRQRERIVCSIAAAKRWGIPPAILLVVAELEGGKPGQWVRNRNGTYDVGPMQFNTRYLRSLYRRYGIQPKHVAARGCYPFALAAWRLRRHLEHDTGDPWTRYANYHSRTGTHNARYREKLMRRALRWQRWLDHRGSSIHRRRSRDPGEKRQ